MQCIQSAEEGKGDIDTISSNYGRDSFVFVYHPETEHSYCFPGIESENTENNAARVHNGVASFVRDGFTLYTIDN